MKAIIVNQFVGPEVLQLMEVRVPPIGQNDILIKVAKTSVNFADVKKRKGNKGKGKFPFTPGLDVAGIVQCVGDQVESFSIGQRVIAFPSNGSYAEYVVAKEVLTFAIPDNVDFTSAAACPTVSILSCNVNLYRCIEFLIYDMPIDVSPSGCIGFPLKTIHVSFTDKMNFFSFPEQLFLES